MAVTTANLVVGNATVSIGGDVGAIKDGITITPTIEVFTIDGIEQELTPTKAWRVAESWEHRNRSGRCPLIGSNDCPPRMIPTTR